MQSQKYHIERERYPKVTRGYENDMRKSFNTVINNSVAYITKKMVDMKKSK